MAVVVSIGDNDIRPVLPDDLNYLELVFFCVLKKAVGQANIFAYSQAEYFGRPGSFAFPDLWRAARTELAQCQVNKAHYFTGGNVFHNRSGAAKLRIVRVHR